MAFEMGTLIRSEWLQLQADQQSLADAARGLPAPAPAESAGSTGSFADSLKSVVQGVDAQDRAAGDKMAAVDRGESDDLVGAMLASQEASLSFSMLMQVRNKVMGAMDELIKLPV